MKILYGVQATGNGHITRARTLAPKLNERGVQVDYLFSGRPAEKLFDMQPFGNYQTRRGLTFVVRNGQVDKWQTYRQNHLLNFFRDVRNLDLSSYDLVVTDFEPVTAWAARLQKVPSIGIAHQYAFNHALPGPDMKFSMLPATRLFAPADTPIGLHWHHFDAPILPPLIQSAVNSSDVIKNKILVYLPFEPQDKVINWLKPLQDYQFYVYCDIADHQQLGHIRLCPFSREQFPLDMQSSIGVIANTGFGLSSEVLQAGKKLLTKPLCGQPEQISNAAVLKYLQLADCFTELDTQTFNAWLEKPAHQAIAFPDVATALADWLADSNRCSAAALCERVWQTSAVPQII